MNLTCETIQDVAVINVEVESLDADNAKDFKAKVADLLTDQNRVVFDLGSLNFIDSSGLGAILSCLRQLHSRGGDLKLANMTTAVRAMIELVRMHRILEIHNTVDEAVFSFKEMAA